MSSLQSICILRLSALGDCINAYAFALGIKRGYADISVSLIMDRRFSALFSDSAEKSGIEIISIDLKSMSLMQARKELKVRLHKRCFDVLFNIQTSIKASILSTAIRAKSKIGYDKSRSREAQFLFINKRALPAAGEHVLDGFLGFARAVDLNVKPCFDLFITDEERHRAHELCPTDNKLFLLSPCSAKKEKNWTFDGYLSCAKHMSSLGYTVVLTAGGVEYEKNYCHELYQKLVESSCSVINLAGKTSLRELAAICSISSLALCPDSGTMHLCNAVGTKVVGLFAIHNEKRVGPYNFMPYTVSVYKIMASAELNNKELSWRYRVKNKNAMQAIRVFDVIDMLNKAVDK